MSPTFATAMFIALVLIVFWRVVLVATVAFLLAAVLIGVGAMPGETSSDRPASEVVQPTELGTTPQGSGPGR